MYFFAMILRRVIYSLILILAVIVLNFTLIHLAPGDPVATMVGEMGAATPEIIAQIRKDFGMDRSLLEQLFIYIWRMAQGDMGLSFYYKQPVARIILQRVPATMILVLSAMFLALILGTFLGIIAARKPYGWRSHLTMITVLAGYSLPTFWTGIMLLILFAYLIPLFPSFGMQSVGRGHGGWFRLLDTAHHLFLPALTLAFLYLAQYSQIARASMMDVLQSDYVRTARAKGLSEGMVVYKHALRNALIPVVTLAGLQFSYVFAGAVVVETVFTWPGMGRLAFDSILRRDHSLLLGILFFSALIVIVANLLTDLSYRLIDPRIKEV